MLAHSCFLFVWRFWVYFFGCKNEASNWNLLKKSFGNQTVVFRVPSLRAKTFTQHRVTGSVVENACDYCSFKECTSPSRKLRSWNLKAVIWPTQTLQWPPSLRPTLRFLPSESPNPPAVDMYFINFSLRMPALGVMRDFVFICGIIYQNLLEECGDMWSR